MNFTVIWNLLISKKISEISDCVENIGSVINYTYSMGTYYNKVGFAITSLSAAPIVSVISVPLFKNIFFLLSTGISVLC